MGVNLKRVRVREDYEILDMADGQKLEKWGDVILSRPDPQIIWKQKSYPQKWKIDHYDDVKKVKILYFLLAQATGLQKVSFGSAQKGVQIKNAAPRKELHFFIHSMYLQLCWQSQESCSKCQDSVKLWEYT